MDFIVNQSGSALWGSLQGMDLGFEDFVSFFWNICLDCESHGLWYINSGWLKYFDAFWSGR